MTRENKFPNLFLVGAPKAGTTFLHAHIVHSPDVFDSGYKEPNFFYYYGSKLAQWGRKTLPVMPEQYNIDKYAALFDDWGTEKYAIDATTRYLHGVNVPENIQRHCTDAKIVIAIRDPIDRAYSHYLMNVRDGWVTDPILDEIEYGQMAEKDAQHPTAFHYGFVDQSLYLDAVKRYVDTFGAESVRVYLFKDITRQLPLVLADLSDFLGIKVEPAPVSNTAKNTFKVERSPLLTRLLQKYHSMSLKLLINRIVPRPIRDRIRVALYKFRSVDGVKPTLDQHTRDRLAQYFEADFEDTQAYARQKGVFFESSEDS